MLQIKFFTVFMLAFSNAFAPSSLSQLRRTAPSVQLRAGLTTSEVDAIIAKGHECEAGECSIDAVDGLVHELMDQQKVLSERVAELENMITSLEIMNGSDKREVDEVRETVRAIFRIFQMSGKGSGNDYPALSKPTGYPGEVGSGTTDAYKSLDPKPWNPSP